ncbi:MAG: HlyD family type I secretion periplasmic adaptor subunit [Alphaproteobacteria bacterium]|nr:HlyD family type I secretion periplasmic adaptor subunit [Alphaproteobacteria bacterium]MBU1560023.1 HlyD family type I secretion periplasmic adaptor subunit [Alphaproteobacteria bacterium]MBU2302325.1 HlyD family type I secretion periplasmic adaptor subunit [Alphaproteobacteria bacterium]MBU2369401.1 HlyD family type I secretion periplasmic adaptor subunit [Alphaproteobacteria bacterium]
MAAPYARSEGLSAGSVKLSDFPLKGRVILGSIMAMLLLGGVGGWAATAKLSGAIISSGTVLVDENVKVIQHLDGGVVRSIDVRKGQTVAAGEVLLQLEDVPIRSEQSILRGQLAELLARQARLVAERDAAAAISFPADYLTNYPGSDLILLGEQQLFDSTRRNRLSQRGQLELQVAQLREEVGGLGFQAAALEDELALAREERARLGELAQKGLVETTRLNAADRELARMLGSQGELLASTARANARISEVELQILAIDEIGYTEAQRELRSVEASIAELQDRLAAVDDRLARTQIRSPVDGTINELSVTTLGGVISPAERLMTIVPEDAKLKIEFNVAVSDIDQVELGQDVKLRFSAFNQRTTPEIEGLVSRVSAAATSDPDSGMSFYVMEAEVIGDLSVLGERGLIPGMPVEVFVQTEQQVALAYFVKPFTDQITRAFREE